MANRRFNQFHMTLVPKLVSIFGEVIFGASGAVTSASGNGVLGCTKLATGIYQLQLQDNYNYALHATFSAGAAPTGSPVADGSFTVGSLYQITSVGTTNWPAIGLTPGVAAAINAPFVATSVGGAGTGTATLLGSSGVAAFETAQSIQGLLTNQLPGVGASIIFKTLAPTSSSVTTLIPSSPNSGCRVRFEIILRNGMLTA